jgi:hypothetical protein
MRRNREEGEKHAQRQPSLEAGEGGIAPANFNGGDVPSVAHSGQGVEGGKEGRCAERLEVSREQRGERRGAMAVANIFTRGGAGTVGGPVSDRGRCTWRRSKVGGVWPRPIGGALVAARVGGTEIA